MQHGAVRRIWKKRTPPHLNSRASMQRLWIFLKSICNCGVSVAMCFIFPSPQLWGSKEKADKNAALP